jgi:hypothetical protein
LNACAVARTIAELLMYFFRQPGSVDDYLGNACFNKIIDVIFDKRSGGNSYPWFGCFVGQRS